MTLRSKVVVVLPGTPVPFARRSRRGGGQYIPERQRNAHAAMRMAAVEAMREADAEIFEGPVSVELVAEIGVPRSWSKKKRGGAFSGALLPVGRPDLDNLYKLSIDAMSSVVFLDDKLVVEIRAAKRYGAEPKITVTVEAV